MSQDEPHTTIIVGIAVDTAKLLSAWEVVSELFLNYADEVIEALTLIAEAISNPLGISEPNLLAAKDLEELFKQTDQGNITLIGTSPKKYGISLRKHSRKAAMCYNYIPRTPRHLPYQRRTY